MTKEKFNGFIFNDIIKKNNDGFLLNTRLHNHEYIELSKITDLVLENEKKKIDAVLLVEPVAKAYVSQNDKFFLEKTNENIKLLTLNVDRHREEVKLTITNFTTNNLTKNTIIVDNKK